MAPKPVVLTWERTCIAMPSQWVGTLADGRVFYGRYRFSNLALGFGTTLDEAVRSCDDVTGPPDQSGGWDGDMRNEDFKHWTEGLLDWSHNPPLVDATGWSDDAEELP